MTLLRNKKFSMARAPYRISLGGGGTDLPFYAAKKSGFLITAAIDEYLTVLVAERKIDRRFFLQYSKTEFTTSIDAIDHRILKEILRYFKIKDSFQIATFSTMPTYTGLGASSALIVAAVTAIRNLKNLSLDKLTLAREAFHIERTILGLAGGYQDQYISALGGIQVMKISRGLEVTTSPLVLKKDTLLKLKNSLVMLYTGIERNSEQIIQAQTKEKNIISMYDKIKLIGKASENYIKEGNMMALGKAMDQHWLVKKKMTAQMSNSAIDRMYIKIKSLGATGGKIIGAGGGGFFLMVVPEGVKEFKKKAIQQNLQLVDFDLDFKGVHCLK